MSENVNIFDKLPEESGDFDLDDETERGAELIPDEINIVPEPTRKLLTSEERSDYRKHRVRLLSWALWEGKNPEKKEGYSESTIKPHAYRIDRFYRFVWEAEDGYTTEITLDHADKYIDLLKTIDESDAHKSQCVKALKILYRWRAEEDEGEKLDMKNPFSSGGSNNPKDYLTQKEREKIREAAYEYGRIPTDGKTEKEIEELRTHLAQRFGVKKDELCVDELRSWKVPSIVEVSLDTGLRPCDFENISVEWVDLDNNRIFVPREDSTKNDNSWELAIRQDTSDVLEKWLKERENEEMYQGTDALWLTRRGNCYNKNSLRDLMHKLFETAGMDTERRQASWYAIRHSTGTYLSEEGGLKHAAAQLRHESMDTTNAYIHPPMEKRREAIEKVGASVESGDDSEKDSGVV